MKQILRLLCLLVVFWGASWTALHASHAMGADISYTYLGGNQYRVRVSFYRDCTGITPSTSLFISVTSASCGQSLSTTANQLPGYPIEVSPLCAAQLPNSTCNGGTLPGVQEYVYEGVITLPMACSDWVFAFEECCRNSSITTLSAPGSEDLYVQATLNNLAFPSNSSPAFTSLPVPYICAGQSYIYNHGAVDADGDSLVYTLINAMNGAGTSVTYNGGFSGTSPMSSAPGVSINSANGNVTMNPTGTQIAVIAVRVDEYRNGVLVGSSVRDIQVTVLNCTNNSPTINNITGVVNGSQTGPYSVTICPGQTLSFNIPGADIDVGQTLTWSWNNGIPGGIFTAPSGPSPQTATFTWTPTAADVGLNSLIVQLQDNGCPVIGSQTRAIDITVLQGTTAGPNQTYCTGGGPVQLQAIGGTTFNWTILSGSPGSLSCTNCANPQATPAVTTTYVVQSNLPGPCVNRDTVVVSVAPSFTLAMGPNQTICTGGSTTLSATPSPSGTYTYVWSPTTGLSSGTISNPTANPTSTTTYNVSVTSAAGCRITGSQTVTVSNAVLSVAPTASPTQSCAGAPVTLSANASSGDCNQYTVSAITYAAPPGGGTSIILSDDQVGAAVPLGFNFGFFCNTYSSVSISSNGFITFNPASGSGCCGGQVIPDAADPNNLVALFWDDLYPPGLGSITYQTLGVAPNRRFVVSYNTIPFCCGSTPDVSGYIVLYETTNVIEVYATSVNNASPATQGIENATGTIAWVSPGRNGSAWSATNDAFRFTPIPPTPFTVNWQAPLGTTVATGTSVNVTPAASTTYYAVADNGICTATAPVTVNVASVDAGPDQTVCPSGSNTSLNATYSGPPAPSNCAVYTVASIPFAPTAPAGTSVTLGDDQVSAAIPIGFSFTFFCNAYSNVYISSNGFVTFNAASGSGCCSGAAMPTAIITDFIAGSWNDLYPPAGGSIQYQTTGVAPNRVFTVYYNSINHCCSAGPINTFQISLFETTNNIEVHSTTITDDGSTHTQGIQGLSGAPVPAPGRNGTNWTATNDAFRWTPQVGAITYSWSPATFLSSTTVSNPNVNGINTATTYTVTVNNGTCVLTDQVTVFICILDADFVHLTATKDETRVKLHWDAQNEQSMSHYVIQRSGDASNWTDIGSMQAIGQPNQSQAYNTYDNDPLAGINYYRLRLVDLNGATELSNQAEVLFSGDEWVNVSPNPSRDVFEFEIGKLKENHLRVDIYNAEGKIVKVLEERDSPAGIRRLRADLRDMPAGVYLYRVQTGSGDLNGRLLKID